MEIRRLSQNTPKLGLLTAAFLYFFFAILFPFVFSLFYPPTTISELSELRIKISQLQAKIEATNKEVRYLYYWLLFFRGGLARNSYD